MIVEQEHVTGHDSKVPQRKIRAREWARWQGALPLTKGTTARYHSSKQEHEAEHDGKVFVTNTGARKGVITQYGQAGTG